MDDQQEKDDALLALSWNRILELHHEAQNGADSDIHMLAAYIFLNNQTSNDFVFRLHQIEEYLRSNPLPPR